MYCTGDVGRRAWFEQEAAAFGRPALTISIPGEGRHVRDDVHNRKDGHQSSDRMREEHEAYHTPTTICNSMCNTTYM